MMNTIAIILTILIIIGSILGCAIIIGGSAVGEEPSPTPYPTPIPTPSDAQARALEAQEAIERAKGEQIRARGELERARAAADVERRLGEAAARAIDRQGNLLTAYVVAGQGKLFGVGILVGVALTAVAIAISIEYYRIKGDTRAQRIIRTQHGSRGTDVIDRRG
jgi:ABC-type transport system involved in multi-copper enzyme maturation permease subunit